MEQKVEQITGIYCSVSWTLEISPYSLLSSTRTTTTNSLSTKTWVAQSSSYVA